MEEDESKALLKGADDNTYDEDDLNLHYDSFPRVMHTPDVDMSVNAVNGDKVGMEGEPIKVYKRRWYILVIFSLFAFTQNGVWNTWGPISTTAIEAFDWSNATIAWLNNWGPVSFILTGFFFPWLLQVKGLRWATLSSMICLMVGTAARVITSEPSTATILINIGQFLNGVAGPIAMGAMPALSATWFPPKERVTATALGTSIGVFGNAVAFVMGPALVSTGPPDINMTRIIPPKENFGFGHQAYTAEPVNVTDARISKERKEIMFYMYYVCAWSAVLTIALLVYFPSKPRQPPCVSATVEREPYWPGLWALRKNRYFLIVALIYGISTGVLNCWSSVININLQPFGVSENTAGWIGFYSVIASGIGSLLIGRFADHFAQRMKLFILIMYTLGLGFLIVFALMLIKVISFSYVLLYLTIIGSNMLINAATPMLYELACELAYPTGEGAANGMLTLFNNFWGLLFLGLFSVNAVAQHNMWMNWAAIASTGICVPLICILKSRFNRLEVDEGVHPEDYLKQDVDIIPAGHGIQAS